MKRANVSSVNNSNQLCFSSETRSSLKFKQFGECSFVQFLSSKPTFIFTLYYIINSHLILRIYRFERQEKEVRIRRKGKSRNASINHVNQKKIFFLEKKCLLLTLPVRRHLHWRELQPTRRHVVYTVSFDFLNWNQILSTKLKRETISKWNALIYDRTSKLIEWNKRGKNRIVNCPNQNQTIRRTILDVVDN